MAGVKVSVAHQQHKAEELETGDAGERHNKQKAATQKK